MHDLLAVVLREGVGGKALAQALYLSDSGRESGRNRWVWICGNLLVRNGFRNSIPLLEQFNLLFATFACPKFLVYSSIDSESSLAVPRCSNS